MTARELIEKTINYIKPYSEPSDLRGSLIFKQVIIWLNQALTALDAEQKEKERLVGVRHPIDSECKINRKHSYCYSCGAGVKNQKYCHNCGGKLDWGSLQALKKGGE